MANVVEVTVTIKDAVTPGLKGIQTQAKTSGAAAGRDFSAGLSGGLAQADAAISDTSGKLDDLGRKDVSARAGVDTGDAGAKLDDLGEKLDDVGHRDVTARADVDTGDAAGKVAEIDGELDDLGHKHVTARVSVDIGEAEAEIAAVDRELNSVGSGGGGGGISLLGAGIGAALVALPALPALLGGAGAAAGVGALAFGSLGKALTDASAASQATGKTAAQLGATEVSNSIAIVNAQRAIGDAKTQAAHDAITSDQQIASAGQAVRDAQTQAAHDAITSEQQVAQAEESLKSAEQSEQMAQESLTQARQQAILTLQQLNNAQADAILGAKQAQLNLEQARVNQQQVDANAKSTALERAQADLSVQEAQQALTEAQQQSTNATKAANQANKEGVNGLPAVVAAQQAAAKAAQGVTDAQKNLANAHQQATWTQQKDAEAIANAQTGLAKAQQQASWSQQKDAEAVAVAEQNLADTYKQQQAAAAASASTGQKAAAQFAKDMAAMTPAGRNLVNELLGMKTALHDLERITQNTMFPGLSVFLAGAKAALPVVSAEIGAMGSILGGAFASAGRALQSSGVQAELKTIFNEGNDLIKILLPAIGGVFSALGRAAQGAGPLVSGLGEGLAGILKGLSGFVSAVAPAAPALGSVFKAVGGLFAALGGPLGKIAATVIDALAPDLVAIAQALSQPAVIAVITGIVNALADLIKMVPPKVVGDIAVGLLAVGAAMKTIKFGSGVLDSIKTFATKLKDLPLIGKLFGGTATVAVEAEPMQAAADTMVTAAEAMQRAADTMVGADVGKPGGGGKVPGGSGVPVVGSFGAGGAIAAGLFVGAFIKAVGDKLSPAGTFAGNLNKQFQADGGLWSTSLLHSFTFGGLEGWITAKFGMPVGKALNDVLAGGKQWGKDFGQEISSTWSDIENGAKQWGKDVGGTVSSAFSTMLGGAKQWVKNIGSTISGGWSDIRGGAATWWRNIGSTISGAMSTIKGGAGQWIGNIKTSLSNGWGSVESTTKTVWGRISGFFTGLKGTLVATFNGIVGGVGGAWNRLEGAFKAPVNFLINTVYDGGIRTLWNDVMGKIGLGSLDLPNVKGLSTGGRLSGYGGGDQHLTLLESGEAVVDKDRTRKFAPLLAAMGVPGFSGGGIIGEAEAAGKMAVAAATGNQTAFSNALASFLPGGTGGAAGGLAQMVTHLPTAMVHDLVSKAWAEITGAAVAKQAATTKSSGGGAGTPGPGGGAPAANAALARKLHPDWGSGAAWNAWNTLEMHEAGWNQFARNPSSGAYGIPQALPPSKMGAAANPPQSNPTAQINWMYGYIKGRYGSPQNAWAQYYAHPGGVGWYANGGATSSGWATVGEHGRELVKVPGGATVVPHGQAEQMIAGGSGGPALVQLEVTGGQAAFDQFMLTWFKNQVRVKGGGNVQKAFGVPGK